MIAAALWMLTTIGYDHVVRTAVYPTEAACEEAKWRPMANIRDRICLPIPGGNDV